MSRYDKPRHGVVNTGRGTVSGGVEGHDLVDQARHLFLGTNRVRESFTNLADESRMLLISQHRDGDVLAQGDPGELTHSVVRVYILFLSQEQKTEPFFANLLERLTSVNGAVLEQLLDQHIDRERYVLGCRHGILLYFRYSYTTVMQEASADKIINTLMYYYKLETGFSQYHPLTC